MSLREPDVSNRIAAAMAVGAARHRATRPGICYERPYRTAARHHMLGVSQPKVSALRHYKLAGFSVERLMTLLTVLDRDVEIVIRNKPRSRSAARITVVAA